MKLRYLSGILALAAGLFAVSCDDTGSYMGKWSGSFVINHPFFLPGCLGLVAAIPFGFLLASIVF